MTELEIVKMSPTDKSISNLKQYRAGSVKKGFKPGPGYRAGYPVNVQEIIKGVISSSVLHLYSGRSDIGNVRVDLECPEATHNITVEEFISSDRSAWEWVVLDPPYKIKKVNYLKNFADARPLSGNALLRDRLSLYLRAQTNNVLWLDFCSPEIRGFIRKKVWLLIPINYWENVRCLTWLTRSGPEFSL